jgi:GNAT superfamily N-acetyltransferase
MMTSALPISVRSAQHADQARWLDLWAGYCAYYDELLDAQTTDVTWQRCLNPREPMGLLMAERDDHIIGFATYVIHPKTWAVAPICYLEDLFVDPPARAQGGGRALIDALIAMAKQQGWCQVYWHTKAGNSDARALYDRFTLADDFVRYRLNVASV